MKNQAKKLTNNELRAEIDVKQIIYNCNSAELK